MSTAKPKRKKKTMKQQSKHEASLFYFKAHKQGLQNYSALIAVGDEQRWQIG